MNAAHTKKCPYEEFTGCPYVRALLSMWVTARMELVSSEQAALVGGCCGYSKAEVLLRTRVAKVFGVKDLEGLSK